jgi:3-oxoacyl-(acyl-carrier-protein) synthase III
VTGRPSTALPVRILGTASVVPGPPRTTAEIVQHLDKPGDAAKWEQRTGIKTRHWVEPRALATPLAAEAIRRALERAGMEPTDLRRILYVCSNGGDALFPATAHGVAGELGLAGSCDAFDIANACMGFLTALDVAARSVVTGLGPVAIVSAELNSRGIRPSDHRPYLVFGDAVAAAIVGEGEPGEGILASFLGNDASLPDDVYADTPLLTGKREYAQFKGTNAQILEIAMRTLVAGLNGLLERADVALKDVEWVLPHQGNGAMLDAMMAGLGLDPAKVIRVVDEVGAVTSACIPVSLDRLLRTRPVRPGDRILMAGLGGGLSYGATLYRVGRDG